MADDIQVISNTKALIGARFCNFETAKAELLDSHKRWLQGAILPILRSQPKIWIDLIGYASRRGDAAFNLYLSFLRCEAIKKWTDQSPNKGIFQIEIWKGDWESGSNKRDNNGYWRAAELYIYSAPPPPKKVLVIPPKPRSIDRVISRSFSKFEPDGPGNPINPGPISPSGRDIVNAAKLIVKRGRLSISDKYGSEQMQYRATARYPVEFRVNTVKIDVTVKLEYLRYGGSVTYTDTTIDYVWLESNSPYVRVLYFRHVLIENRGPQHKYDIDFIPRAEAEDNSLLVPDI